MSQRGAQSGAISLPIVIAAVLGLGFGASAYLNYAQFQRADQDKKLLNGTITDLKYQVEQDKLASNTSPSPSPSDTPSPSPSTTPTPSPAGAGASTQTAVVRVSGNVHLTMNS